MKVGPAFDISMADTLYILWTMYCCMSCCSTKRKERHRKVWAAIEDPDIHVIAQTAPAVRAGLGEEFDFDGDRVTVKW